jgi:hypothetical protein
MQQAYTLFTFAIYEIHSHSSKSLLDAVHIPARAQNTALHNNFNYLHTTFTAQNLDDPESLLYNFCKELNFPYFLTAPLCQMCINAELLFQVLLR